MAAADAYREMSALVRAINTAIDEEADPTARAHLKAALVQAHAAEDAIADALELQHRPKAT